MFPFEHEEENLYGKDDWGALQIPQKGCRNTALRGTLKLSGYGSVQQMTLFEHGFGQDDLQSSHSTSTIVQFCDSAIIHERVKNKSIYWTIFFHLTTTSCLLESVFLVFLYIKLILLIRFYWVFVNNSSDIFVLSYLDTWKKIICEFDWLHMYIKIGSMNHSQKGNYFLPWL